MKKMISILSFFVAGAFAVPDIIPQPVEMTEMAGTMELKPDAVIVYADASARQPAEMLAAQLRPATGFELPVKQGAEGSIIFQTREDPALGREGYALRVTSRVLIEAPTAAGLFYGAQTLRQLLPPEIYSEGKVSCVWNVPAVEIRDVPRFGWRGLHLDVSRHFIPKDDVIRYIDTMASLKFNTFHWHLTDDQGWRIEIKKYPRLTEIGAWREETMMGYLHDTPRKYDGQRHGGFYTQEEIREVVAYAAARHIVVVPEIDMPGHMQAAVAAYPELGCTTNRVGVKKEWGVSAQILSPEESSIQFCKDVLTEVMELFPSEFIHIGGDEAKKDLWEQSERIQQLREERGLKDMHEMQSWFIQQIDDFLVANNRRLIGWDEIAEGGLAQNATVMWWRGYQGAVGLNIAKAALKNGQDLVIAPNNYLYFNHYQAKEGEPIALGGFTPLEKVYGFDPILEGLDATAATHVLGAQGQLWTEYISDMELGEYMLFPRACALAELVWLPRNQKDYASFLERMKVQEKRFDAAGVNYRPLDQPGIAVGKAVMASSYHHKSGRPELAVDGFYSTRWTSEYSDPQWICVDLGVEYAVKKVEIVWEAAFAKAYVIEVSSDGENFKEACRIDSGDGETDLIKFAAPLTTRWLRMTGTQRGTQWGYSIYEFKVFGDPVEF